MQTVKNNNEMFYKMYHWILEARKLNTNERIVLGLINSFCEKNKTAVVSLGKLNKMMARSTAQKTLASLEEKQLINRGKTFKLGTHYSVADNLLEMLVEKYGVENRYLPSFDKRIPSPGTQYGTEYEASGMVPKTGNSKYIKDRKSNKEDKSSPSNEEEKTVPLEPAAKPKTKPGTPEYYALIERAAKDGWF